MEYLTFHRGRWLSKVVAKTPEYQAWEARRDECLRIGHVWQGNLCKQCGAAKHGNAKVTRPDHDR